MTLREMAEQAAKDAIADADSDQYNGDLEGATADVIERVARDFAMRAVAENEMAWLDSEYNAKRMSMAEMLVEFAHTINKAIAAAERGE